MTCQIASAAIQNILDDAVIKARLNREGMLADYIPELANVDSEKTAAAIMLVNGDMITAGDANGYIFTLQSVAKLVLLAGLLEEAGPEKVWSWVGSEPTGRNFASIALLEGAGAIPWNPLVNAGAIALCARIPGDKAQKLSWLDQWVTKVFGKKLAINEAVYQSEQQAADKNRAIAYLLKHNGVIKDDVEMILDVYITLCAYQADIATAAYLPYLLAREGFAPNDQQILSRNNVRNIKAVMATCGLYDESGYHLVRTGMPAKSGVSGLMVAVERGIGGIAVASPRLNSKGGSIRGHIILQSISDEFETLFKINMPQVAVQFT